MCSMCNKRTQSGVMTCYVVGSPENVLGSPCAKRIGLQIGLSLIVSQFCPGKPNRWRRRSANGIRMPPSHSYSSQLLLQSWDAGGFWEDSVPSNKQNVPMWCVPLWHVSTFQAKPCLGVINESPERISCLIVASWGKRVDPDSFLSAWIGIWP